MSNDKSKKDVSISFARLIAMIFIVVCHFFQYYDNELAWWFNVGVQIFFCISGFLYGNKEINSPINFIVKNFKKILIPYFCFLIPAIIIYFLFERESIGLSNTIYAILCSGTIHGMGHLWFISYILFCYLITPYLYELSKKLKEYKAIVLFAVVCGLMLFGQVIFYAYDVYFSFSRIFCYIAGYFLGVILAEYGIKYFKKLSCLIIIGGVLLNIFRVYLKYFTEGSFYGFSFFEQYAHALLGISLFLIMYLFLHKNVKLILKLSDEYSYSIYIVHQLLILSPFSLMSATPIIYLNWVLVLVAILALAFILKKVSDKATLLFDKFVFSLKNKLKKIV